MNGSVHTAQTNAFVETETDTGAFGTEGHAFRFLRAPCFICPTTNQMASLTHPLLSQPLQQQQQRTQTPASNTPAQLLQSQEFMAQMAFNHPFSMPQEQLTTGTVRSQRAMSMGSGNAAQLHHSLLQQQLQMHSPSTPVASPKSQAFMSNLNLLKASPQISQANLSQAFQQQLQQQQQQQQQQQNQHLLQFQQQQQQQQQQQLQQKQGQQQQLVSVTELNQIKLQLLQQQMQISQLCDQNRQLSMQMAQLLMLQQSSPKPVMQTAVVAPQTPSLMSSPEGQAGKMDGGHAVKMEEGMQQQQLKRTRVDSSTVSSSDNDLFADLAQSL